MSLIKVRIVLIVTIIYGVYWFSARTIFSWIHLSCSSLEFTTKSPRHNPDHLRPRGGFSLVWLFSVYQVVGVACQSRIKQTYYETDKRCKQLHIKSQERSLRSRGIIHVRPSLLNAMYMYQWRGNNRKFLRKKNCCNDHSLGILYLPFCGLSRLQTHRRYSQHRRGSRFHAWPGLVPVRWMIVSSNDQSPATYQNRANVTHTSFTTTKGLRGRV